MYVLCIGCIGTYAVERLMRVLTDYDDDSD